MPAVRIVVVEPKSEGNVGAIARVMRNFDVEDLTLVNPCPLGEEARKRAMHGLSILEAATFANGLASAVEGADLVIGTSGIQTAGEKRFARIAVSPRELASRVAPMAGLVAIVLGREDFGLLDEELERCDILVTIPASDAYTVLNVAQAAAIILYELFVGRTPPRVRRKASGLEKEKLHASLTALLEATDYPIHKRTRARVMFRRMMGRAVPSTWEFHVLMGVFERATKRIRRLEGRR